MPPVRPAGESSVVVASLSSFPLDPFGLAIEVTVLEPSASAAIVELAAFTVTRPSMYARVSWVTFANATPAPPPAEQHKEITVPVSTLSKYPGTYVLRPNVVLTVTLEDDHLMAQPTGQPKFQIFAESETVFFYKIVEATLEFQTDASGATTGVRLKQGPTNTVLPKK